MMWLLLACTPDSGPPPTPVVETPAVEAPAVEAPAVEAPAEPKFAASSRALSDAERTAMTGPVWREGCPVGLDELRRLEVSYWRPDGTAATGAVVVATEAVEPLTSAFHALWDQKFPIDRMEPIEAYGGQDTPSMEANNTSAFNCRYIKRTSSWSRHSYGNAIDVNPLWNPYVKAVPTEPDGIEVDPPSGRPWADRTRTDPGLFKPGSEAVRAFTDAGWKWGGDWTEKKDWQHFSADGG